MINYRLSLILSILIAEKIFCRIFQTPLPYNNCGYSVWMQYKFNYSKCRANDNLNNNYKIELDCTIAPFYRRINGSFGSFGENFFNLAYLFHGQSVFELSDLFYGSQMPLILGSYSLINNPLKKHEYTYVEGKVYPNYIFNRSGAVIGIDLFSSISTSKYFAIQARIPFQAIDLTNINGWRNLKEISVDRINDDRVFLQSWDKYFAVRSDFIKENNIIINNESDVKRSNFSDDFILIDEKNFDKNIISLHGISSIKNNNNELLKNLNDTGEKSSLSDSFYYVVTKLDSNDNVKRGSEVLYENIENIMNLKSYQNLAYNLISGYMKNGCFYDWSNFHNVGFGNLDLQFDFCNYCCESGLIGHILFALVIPVEKYVEKISYLSIPLDNNQHFAIRIGAQGSYDLFSYFTLVGYASYEYALAKEENFFASFKGAYAFGMQPEVITAKVSWGQAIFSLDAVVNFIENYGFSFGCMYLYKNKDLINNFKEKAQDATGIFNIVDYNYLVECSQRQALKGRATLYTNIKENFQVEIGVDKILFGKNIGREIDFFGRITYSF
jgi:hypothetical protein